MEKEIPIKNIQSTANTKNECEETDISVKEKKNMELYIKLHIANHRPGWNELIEGGVF